MFHTHSFYNCALTESLQCHTLLLTAQVRSLLGCLNFESLPAAESCTAAEVSTVDVAQHRCTALH